MKHVLLFTFLLITSCGQQKTNESDLNEDDSLANSKIEADTLVSSEITTETTESNDTPQEGIKVTAFLVYEGGELSSFDILNDENVALWNTIIGEGSAERSSHETKIIIYGNEKEIDIVIKNDGEVSIDMRAVEITGQLEISVPDTGCSLVEIILSRKDETLYQGVIPFECGE